MLCDPLFNDENGLVLAALSVQQGELALQHVRTEKDTPEILALLKKEIIAQQWDVGLLLDMYHQSLDYIAGSGIGQAFVLRWNDELLFEIELHDAKYYETQHTGYNPLKGDYIINLVAGDFTQAGMDLFVQGLQLCLHYFFGHTEVTRILAAIPDASEAEQERRTVLFTRAGLNRVLERSRRGEPELFALTRPA